MRKIIALISAFVLIASLVGYGGWRAYQNHLSGDVRRLLEAGVDGHATDADIAAYLRDARVRVRTARDRRVFEEFERSIELLRDAGRRQQSEASATMGELEELGRDPCQRMFDSSGHIDRVASRECDLSIEDHHRRQDIRKIDDAVIATDTVEGKKLFNHVRQELGLPSVTD